MRDTIELGKKDGRGKKGEALKGNADFKPCHWENAQHKVMQCGKKHLLEVQKCLDSKANILLMANYSTYWTLLSHL